MRLIAAIILLSSGVGCTTYSSIMPERKIFFATTGNLGIVTSEQVGNNASIAGSTVRSSLANGQRSITAEAVGAPSIAFADGTVITGTIDHSSGLREGGNALKNFVLIKGLRDVWLKLIGSSEDVITEAIRR